MLSPAIRLEPNVPDFNFCLAMCAGRVSIFEMQPKYRALFEETFQGYHKIHGILMNTVYPLRRNPGRHIRHLEPPRSHLRVCYKHAFKIKEKYI